MSKFTNTNILKDSINSPTGWGLKKDSELLEFINYHLVQMTETGIISKFRRDAESGEGEGDRAIRGNVVVLGYENVAFPFLALLGGLVVALIHLGVEIINIWISNFVQKKRSTGGTKPYETN